MFYLAALSYALAWVGQGLVATANTHDRQASALFEHATGQGAYEEAEDPVIERQFTTAHAIIARLRMATEDYEGGLESYQVAAGLSPWTSATNATRSAKSLTSSSSTISAKETPNKHCPSHRGPSLPNPNAPTRGASSSP